MPTDPTSLTFEQAYAELEAVVRQLETSDLTLEASLALYEQGQHLAARCQALLEQAELRVQQLSYATGAVTDFSAEG